MQPDPRPDRYRHATDPTSPADSTDRPRTPSRLGAVLSVAIPVAVTGAAAFPEFTAGAATTALVVAAGALLR